MLGLAHTLIATQRPDLEFLARYCTGYEAWRAYLLGETDGIVKDAAWAARICDVDASVIRGLCQGTTAQRTMLLMSWSY
jgi:anaerobic selenocysteine-containing dehydrogenase